MRRVFRAFSMFLIFSICTVVQSANGQATHTDMTKDEEGIRKVLADFVDAWNKHDAKAFSMVFAKDADFTNVAGVSVHGREEVERFHAPRFETTFKDTKQKITQTKIRFLKPDVAAVDARWEMTGAKNREGQDLPLRIGLLNFVMTKQDGNWSITVMHNMNLPSTP